MLPLLVSFTVSILVLVVTYFCSLYTYWTRCGILQEPPVPLFGNYKGVGRSHHIRDINRRLYGLFKGKAPYAGVYMFVKKAVLILDLDLIKNILVKDFSKFTNRGVYSNAQDDPLTGHLVTLDGEEWRAMRHKLTPVFTSARMKYMFSTIVKVGDHFRDIMMKKINTTVDMKDFCARFTIDVIGQCAFGMDSNCLENLDEEFRLMALSVFTNRRHHPLIEQFIFTNPKISKFFHLRMFKDEVTEYFLSVIKQTVAYRQEHKVKRNDFMDLLIDLKAEDEVRAKASQGIDLSLGLTTEQMAAQAFSFLIAGFESSSTTISFCLYELAMHTEIQEKLRQEILENLKENGQITYEGLKAMQYLDKVVKETLRFYPPLTHHIRVSEVDYNVPNFSGIIPKDTLVMIPIEAIQHDPEYFEEPEIFNPSRFEGEAHELRHPCAYLPFGDGPRNCIGLRFGLLQTKIGLVSLLRHLRFEPCEATQIPIEIDKENFFLSTKRGINLKVMALE